MVGLGYVGKIHLRHSLSLSNVKSVAVADVSKKALYMAKRMGVKNTYLDYKQLAERSDVDAVVISLPTHLHRDCALCFAEAGKDIFLEKPLATNPKQGREIVYSAERYGVKLMVGYPYRFNPAFRNLKEQLCNGELGEIQVATATFIGTGPFMHRAEGYAPVPVPSWWFDKRLTGGGALIDLGCHAINLLRWYLGEITDIRSYLGHRFHLELEDYACCIAKFKHGQIGFINVGWYSLGHEAKVELFGTAANSSAKVSSHSKLLQAVQLLIGRPSQYYLPHFWELQYFVNCVANDRAPSPSGKDGLKDLEAIQKAYDNQVI
ncbi:MAG: Gfo/Idh/MocA family oxidoreductase [Candidatus Bathyarchaeia archaeon]